MSEVNANIQVRENIFHIRILGRTLEHLGVQMYKQRNAAIAELIANSWDAGCDNVYVTVLGYENYNPYKSEITIEDDGCGMDARAIQDDYLVIGKNRRKSGQDSFGGRPVMGRKGIGKLAGFGIAEKMTIQTWVENTCNTFTLDLAELKAGDGETSNAEIKSIETPPPDDINSDSGTKIILRKLKHVTPLDIEQLHQSLSRRFSRSIRGEMSIQINGEQLREPELDVQYAFPEEEDEYLSEDLGDGNNVRYRYSFTHKPIRETELRGFSIYTRGKTAQAPNFFFDMEGVARGQHCTKYLTGVIIADFLDDGIDDAGDIISTDRQEIDWENQRVAKFREWGRKLVQELFNQWIELRGDNFENAILEDIELKERVDRLDPNSKKQVSRFLRILGQAESDPERAKELGDALIRAYEYRVFHDVIGDIETISEDPEQLQLLLTYMHDWKVLESRAILEIVRGRLGIIEKFHAMVVNDVPETAGKTKGDNLHDLLAEYPWILNPEWQVLTEEKSISQQLKAWNKKDLIKEGDAMRYDFLALSDEGKIVIIEIKRSSHAVELVELNRLVTYRERLSKANNNIYMVMLCGGSLNISRQEQENWDKRTDGEIMTWKVVYKKTKQYYQHYEAILTGDKESPDFGKKEREVRKTREIIQGKSVYRGPEGRKEGIGGQDVDFTDKSTNEDSKEVKEE